jgi:hypothetical protein
MFYFREKSAELAEKWNKRFERLAAIEQDVATFFAKDSKDRTLSRKILSRNSHFNTIY